MRDTAKASDLLDWYDTHARTLPWRTSPSDRAAGIMPDPYAVWLSEIMLQQTTVAAVKSYFTRFLLLWPTVEALAAARDEDVMAEWAGLGYYARARNLLKCARAVTELGGFPQTRAELEALPGIGPYTSAAISSIAYDHPETVLDGNVERVMSRLYAVLEPLPDSKETLRAHAAGLTPDQRAGDYAQAVMDLGATLCTPKSPACGICPWRAPCTARAEGIADTLPRKRPKAAKPTRLGIAYIARREDGAWLMERRPDKGLLGGMLGWPGAAWGDERVAAPPLEADWQKVNDEALHTFTHFHLRLDIHIAILPQDVEIEGLEFVPKHSFSPKALPTVMRKAFDLAQSAFNTASQ